MTRFYPPVSVPVSRALALALALALVSVLASGCAGQASSGSAIGGSPNSGGAGSGGAAGSSAGSGDGGQATCPAVPPQGASACSQPAPTSGLEVPRAQCSWGDDPRAECRTTAVCQTNLAWEVTAPAASCSEPILPAGCPASASDANGQCADQQSSSCYYDDGTRCICSPCQGGSQYPVCHEITPPEWACTKPLTGCPALLPQAGSACSDDGQECGPSCELSVSCEKGAWIWRRGNCPICAAPDTPIATPSGEVPISELRPGDLVFSINANGIVAVPILRVGRTPVFAHHVVHVELDSGAILNISPGHPTADGHTFGELVNGQALDPLHFVKRAELIPYDFDATYDILPASDTGTYFAAGTPIGSSLFHLGSAAR